MNCDCGCEGVRSEVQDRIGAQGGFHGQVTEQSPSVLHSEEPQEWGLML